MYCIAFEVFRAESDLLHERINNIHKIMIIIIIIIGHLVHASPSPFDHKMSLVLASSNEPYFGTLEGKALVL